MKKDKLFFSLFIVSIVVFVLDLAYAGFALATFLPFLQGKSLQAVGFFETTIAAASLNCAYLIFTGVYCLIRKR